MGDAPVPAAAWRGGNVTPEQMKGLLRQGQVAVLDVRTEEEVQAWPFPGALHVPLDQLAQRAREALPGDRPVVALCASGRRSGRAAAFLAGQGFQVANLEGGMHAWGQTYDHAVVPTPGGAGAVVQVRRLGKGCLSYVVASEGEAVVVDPTCHLEATLGLVRARGWKVAHVVDTHRHADHVSGSPELARATGATLHLSARDGYAPGSFQPLHGGAQLKLGHRAAVVLDAAPTPGHTPGSLTFLAEGKAALTGDALFLDGVGRPDLRNDAEGMARDLWRTYQRVGGWDDRLLVLPAHLSPRWPLHLGEPAARPLGAVRQDLGVFGMGEEAFVQRTLARLPPRPPNYQRILELNQRVLPADLALADELEAGGNQCVVT